MTPCEGCPFKGCDGCLYQGDGDVRANFAGTSREVLDAAANIDGCPSCGTNSEAPLRTVSRALLYRCSDCGHVWKVT